MATLKLTGVRKRFGTVDVIRGVDLAIEEGEFVVFVGPSGCGKSTLLRMICGLEEVSDGDVLIDGIRVNELPAAARGLAMVFQSYALYPHMSVRKNLSFGLENLHTPADEIARRVGEAARMLRLEDYLDRRPTALSGGQRQRVAIGRAIVRDPRMFLFDEPLSNLDAELRVQMRAEIMQLHDRLGTTMIYVTHDQVEAMTMADRIVVLRAGRIEQVGRPLDLYNHPANLFVAGFIGSPRMNFLKGRIVALDDLPLIETEGGVRLRCAIDPSGRKFDEAVTIGIRPEHVDIGAAAVNTVELTVRGVEQLGSTSYLATEGPDLTVQMPGQTELARGARASFHFPPERCYVFDAGGAALPLTTRNARS